MKKINIKLLYFVLVLLAMSCKKDTYEAPKSATVAMSGRWLNELVYDSNKDGIFNETDGDELIYAYEEHHSLVTSNTAANTADSLLVDFPDGDLYFKIKTPINLSGLEFKPATILNINSDFSSGETITIISGKILKGAGHTKSGLATDSIFIKFVSSTDSESNYIITGHRDSGQDEDQY